MNGSDPFPNGERTQSSGQNNSKEQQNKPSEQAETPPELLENIDWGNPKELTRKFQLQIQVPMHGDIIKDVLDSIEVDELLVFDPSDKTALDSDPNSRRDKEILKGA